MIASTPFHTETTPFVTFESHTIEATCPSCGNYATYDYCGAQTFPVRATQIPRVLYLYTCHCCGSTLSHLDLELDLVEG